MSFTLTWDSIEEGKVSWRISVYTLGGSLFTLADYNGNSTRFVKNATDLTWTIPLNGIDTLEFSLFLDDPAALAMATKSRIIRIWRVVNDVEAGKFYAATGADGSNGTPDFCGIITSITKSAEENKMKIFCQSPLWRIQTHFHIDNHRLENDLSSFGGSDYEGGNANDLPWDHSALMFRLIDMINGAFKHTGSDTGIRKPLTASYSGTGYLSGYSLYWPQTIQVSPFYVQKGAYTYPLVFDDLLARPGSPDLSPTYIWQSGTKKLMYFNTAIRRGTDRTSTTHFDYRTGTRNLDDVEEQTQVVPGTYANFVWAVGDGGPNGGQVGQAENDGNMNTNGIYMARFDVPGAKIRDLNGTDGIAADKLAVSLIADAPVYTVKLSPASATYYLIDYEVGDLIELNVDRGAFQVSGLNQRIYQVALSLSDNNVETAEIMVSSDFKRKFP
jgi:hypothetical protein